MWQFASFGREFHYSDLSVAGSDTLDFGKQLCMGDDLYEGYVYVRLDLGDVYNYGDLLDPIAVALTLQDPNGGSTFNESRTLIIDKNSPVMVWKVDITTLYPNINHLDISWQAINCPQCGVLQGLNNDVRIKIWHEVDRRIPVPSGITSPTLTPLSSPQTSSRTTFQWSAVCGASQYKVQVLKLYNENAAYTSDEQVYGQVAWGRALRLETAGDETELSLTLSEGTGYYIWRVQPVFSGEPNGVNDPRNLGSWSSFPAGGSYINCPNSGNCQGVSTDAIFFYQQFDEDKNWIHSRIFTEEMRTKEGMVYANGLQQTQQNQSRLQSQENIIATQQIYDYSARPALNSLAAPINQNSFGYKEKLLTHNNNLYTAEHFDDDNQLNFIDPLPVNGGAINDYFSDNNPDKTIPNAEEYPFSRILFYNDGMGRPREEGAPGNAHKLTSTIEDKHTVRTYYAGVSDAELIRVFGNEAPKAERVQKVITLDPNNTAPVQYISDGNVIANCLAITETSDLLEDLPSRANALFSINDEITDDASCGQGCWNRGKVYAFTEPTNFHISYYIDPTSLYGNCGGGCFQCTYTLELKLTRLDDPCITDPVWSYNDIIDESCGGTPFQKSVTTKVEPGSYRLERILRSDPLSANGQTFFEQYQQQAMDELENTIQTSFLDELYDRLDQNDIEGFYQALSEHSNVTILTQDNDVVDDQGNNVTVTETSYLFQADDNCCTMEIPDIRCPKFDCSETNFTNLLLESAQVQTLEDLNIVYDEITINKLFHNLVGEGYNCETVLACVTNAGNSWEELNEILDDPTNPPLPPSHPHNIDILDLIFDCVGVNPTEITDAPIPPTRAYGYFAYTLGMSPTCEEIFLGAPASSMQQIQLLPLEDRLQFIECVQALQAGSLIDITTISPSIVQQEVQDQCSTICQSRYQSFLDGTIAMLEEQGVAPNLIEEEARCIAQNLVENCLQGCQLTITPDGLGTPDEQTAVTQSMTYAWDIQTPNGSSCPTGYDLIQNDIAQNQILIDYLNDQIEEIREQYWAVQPHNQPDMILIPGIDISGIGICQGQTNLTITDCNGQIPIYRDFESEFILNPSDPCEIIYVIHIPKGKTLTLCDQTVIGSVTQEGSISSSSITQTFYFNNPTGGTPAVFDAPPHITIDFPTHLGTVEIIELTHEYVVLTIVPTSNFGLTEISFTLQASQIYYEVDGCRSCDIENCPVCFKWEMREIQDPIEISLQSCEEETAEYLRDLLEASLQSCLIAYGDQLQEEFQTQCEPTTLLNDKFTASYKAGYHHYMLFYYDRAGRLSKTVPPAGVVYQTDLTSRANSTNHTLETTYKYNSLNQVVEQHSPDGGTRHLYYDNLGRLRFSQNAQQLLDGKYSYIKYDNLGRAIEAGQSSWASNTNLLEYVNNPLIPYLTSFNEEVIFTKYAQAANVTFSDGSPQRHLRNRISYTYTDGGVYTFFSYDPHGNIEWAIRRLPGLPDQYLKYDIENLSGNTYKFQYNPGQTDQFYHRYSYDEDNRILLTETSSDGVIWENDINYQYNLHGFIKREEIGHDKIQGLDYVQTIRGWLKAINNPILATNPNADPGQDGIAGSLFPVDAFGMKLHYFEGDFNRQGSVFSNTNNAFNSELLPSHLDNTYQGLYNGNITSWHTSIKPVGDSQLKFENQTGYIYKYDELNKLIAGNFYERDLTTTPQWNSQNQYNVTYQYDSNSNLLNLTREQSRSSGNDPNPNLDNLTYHYYPNTNRIEYIDDLVNGIDPTSISDQQPNNYQYNAIGNLIRSESDEVEIEWNSIGKIASIIKLDGSWELRYLYDQKGDRVLKHYLRHLNGSTTEHKYTWYILNLEGDIASVYEKEETIQGQQTVGNSTIYQSQIPIYGRNKIGVFRSFREIDQIQTDSLGIYSRRYDYRLYELKDHLSNVRAVVSDKKLASFNNTMNAWKYDVSLITYSNYYPFGLEQPNRNFQSTEYTFGLNGQEEDREWLNSQAISFKYRVYDPRLSRFFSVDPIALKYPWWTPYQFAGNNPIAAQELEGLEPGMDNKRSYAYIAMGYTTKEFEDAYWGGAWLTTKVVLETATTDLILPEVLITAKATSLVRKIGRFFSKIMSRFKKSPIDEGKRYMSTYAKEADDPQTYSSFTHRPRPKPDIYTSENKTILYNTGKRNQSKEVPIYGAYAGRTPRGMHDVHTHGFPGGIAKYDEKILEVDEMASILQKAAGGSNTSVFNLFTCQIARESYVKRLAQKTGAFISGPTEVISFSKTGKITFANPHKARWDLYDGEGNLIKSFLPKEIQYVEDVHKQIGDFLKKEYPELLKGGYLD